jgi:hypothetical protein
MPAGDSDKSIMSHINRLVEEEKELYKSKEPSPEVSGRLNELKVQLDQCWDLLRQREALSEFGKDPDKAKVRPRNIVENYEQ